MKAGCLNLENAITFIKNLWTGSGSGKELVIENCRRCLTLSKHLYKSSSPIAMADIYEVREAIRRAWFHQYAFLVGCDEHGAMTNPHVLAQEMVEAIEAAL